MTASFTIIFLSKSFDWQNEFQINELRTQINDFKKRQERLREEVNENVKYYTGMLDNIEGTAVNDGYEIVKKTMIGGILHPVNWSD